jgi:hypothetical protein
LRQSERASIDNTICPSKPKLSKLVCEIAHGVAPLELKHEGNVLKQEPLRIGCPKQLKHIIDQPGPAASDASCPPCLAEILAWESCCYQIYVREAWQLSDIRLQPHCRKVTVEDGLSGWVDFAQQ